MKKTNNNKAFTLIELLLVVGIIGILASMLMPSINKSKARAQRIQCVSNLRQVGDGFHLFAMDHSGLFPMSVHARDGGTLEYWTSVQKMTTNAFRHFQALSNELNSPKIALCPSDSRVGATNWNSIANTNLSYFVWLPSRQNISSDPLAGDRNVYWRKRQSTLPNDSFDYFWQTNIHMQNGNIGFADGRVEELNDIGLRRAIQAGLAP